MSPVVNRTDISHVLAQMKAMREAAQGRLDADMRAVDAAASLRPGAAAEQARPSSTFSGLFEAAINGVNRVQSESSKLSSAFARGESNDLVRVMVQSQKSNVAFQALMQGRNRMVSAYQEIMNMRI